MVTVFRFTRSSAVSCMGTEDLHPLAISAHPRQRSKRTSQLRLPSTKHIRRSPMPPLRPPTYLSKRSAFLCSHPVRNSLQSRLLPGRTLASTHPPDVSEHPSPETATHESHYDPPSGWLFCVPPGQKYQKEGWENTWVYGFWGSLLFGVVAYAYKPDTS